MTRRELFAAAGAAVLARGGWAAGAPPDVRITRVVAFELKLRRPKYVGKNSHRDDHGETSGDRILRIYTNTGIDGFGTSWSGANDCARLLGRNPFDFFRADDRRVMCPLGRFTSPLWDLIGKLRGKPVCELLGGGPGRVPVYDGSVYFSELVPQYAARGLDRLKDEVDLGLAMGHRGFKAKVGRGYHWMLAEEGFARDLEAIRVIRRHAGPDILLGTDSNVGYDFDRTKRFLAELGDCNLAFVEEMFPMSVERYVELKAFIRERGWKTMTAAGEDQRRPADMKRWVEAKAVDILQGDMNQFGFEDVMAEADLGRPAGAMVAPHNWGSLLGFYLQLHAARAIPNFFRAEHDPLSCPALIAEGYAIRDGYASVPAAPGLGLKLDDARLPDHARPYFDLKA